MDAKPSLAGDLANTHGHPPWRIEPRVWSRAKFDRVPVEVNARVGLGRVDLSIAVMGPDHRHGFSRRRSFSRPARGTLTSVWTECMMMLQRRSRRWYLTGRRS